MQAMKELMEVSAFVPKRGYSLDLKKMVAKGLSRKEAISHWIGLGRSSGSFYRAYKNLKDELIKFAFLERNHASDLKGRRMDIWDKYSVINQLLISQKKRAAVPIAVELIPQAQRLGITEVVLSLASMLEGHFGCFEIDTRRYLRYRKIKREYEKIYKAELDVKSLQSRLVFSLERKKDLKEFEREVGDLIKKNTGSPTFMRHRFTALSAWFNLKNDVQGLMAAFKETIQVYENCKVDITASSLASLYYPITQILVENGHFAEAEAHTTKAVHISKEGTQNWHLFMLQRACLGLVSGKVGMAQSCLKKALDAPREHANADIDRRWLAVKGILDGERVGDVWKAVFF